MKGTGAPHTLEAIRFAMVMHKHMVITDYTCCVSSVLLSSVHGVCTIYFSNMIIWMLTIAYIEP